MAATGGLVQALVDRNQTSAFIWTGIYLATSVVEQVYWPLRNLLSSDILDNATYQIQKRVLVHAGSVPLIAFEQGSFFARLQRANDNLGERLSDMFMRLHDCLQLLVFAVSIMVPLWLVDPWIVLILVVAMVPSAIVEFRTAELFHEVRTRHALGDHFIVRIGAILIDRNAAAELRLFGNGPDLVKRWSNTRGDRGADMIDAERRKIVASTIGDTTVLIALIASLAIVVKLLLNQDASIGAWAVVGTGTSWLSGMGYAIGAVSRSLRENSVFVSDLFALEEEYERRWANDSVPNASTGSPLPAPVGGMSIHAENVSFHYPESSRCVIDDISLQIAAGEHVALVGENGAGKSTLVGLLTGLYDPASGVVHLDGMATTGKDSERHQGTIGAVFQDYVPWQMTMRDNIGMGDLTRLDDECGLMAASQQAGIADLLDDLPEGLDTWLGRQFGERDLSGGQWQRIALARAFFRYSRFLVLDEPTAALDPLAEQRIFERFAALASGKTALMISHRLGVARFADRILVMDAGRIVETGTHVELMNSKGAYARMFDAQAEWYNHK